MECVDGALLEVPDPPWFIPQKPFKRAKLKAEFHQRRGPERGVCPVLRHGVERVVAGPTAGGIKLAAAMDLGA